MANGDLHLLGTLWLDQTKQPNPTKPWRTDSSPVGFGAPGNIPVHTASALVQIKDSDALEAYKIRWREVNWAGKKLLVSDRVILNSVSWDYLNSQGMVTGTEVELDGGRYKLRLLTGGSAIRGAGNGYEGGAPEDNEWDQIIAGEASFPGLPTPSASDIDATPDRTDAESEYNRYWNWYQIGSWVQDVTTASSFQRAVRGLQSARLWARADSGARVATHGWRPVLEVLTPPNKAPVISGQNADLGAKTGAFTYEYSATDTDGEVTVIEEYLNGVVVNTINTPEPGLRTFTVSRELLQTLPYFKTHEIKILAYDETGDYGGRVLRFTRALKPLAPDAPLQEVAESLAEGVAYGKTGRAEIADALRGIGGVVGVGETLSELRDAILKLPKGGKMASGTTAVQSGTTMFYNTADTGEYYYTINLPTLDFVPDLILTTTRLADNAWNALTLYSRAGFGFTKEAKFLAGNYLASGTSQPYFSALTERANTVGQSDIKIPVSTRIIAYNQTHDWYAIKF